MLCRAVIYPVFSVEKAFRNSHRRITGSSHSVCGRMKKAKRVVEGTRRDGICTKIMMKLLRSSYVGLVANCFVLYLNGTRVPKWHIPAPQPPRKAILHTGAARWGWCRRDKTTVTGNIHSAKVTCPREPSLPQADGYSKGFVHAAQTSLLPDGLYTSMLDCT